MNGLSGRLGREHRWEGGSLTLYRELSRSECFYSGSGGCPEQSNEGLVALKILWNPFINMYMPCRSNEEYMGYADVRCGTLDPLVLPAISYQSFQTIVASRADVFSSLV